LRIAKTINTLPLSLHSKLNIILSESSCAVNPIIVITSRPTKKLKRTAKNVILFFALSLFACSHATFAQSINYDSDGLKIELSDDIQKAIDSGVSLTFENEFAHTRRFFFFHWHSELVKHEFVVTRHTLSNLYLVHESNKLEPRNFSSTRETMNYISQAALDRFSKYHSKHPHSLSLSEHEMRLRLSKTKLPGPMRLTAFIGSDWDLDSGWKVWQSDQ